LKPLTRLRQLKGLELCGARLHDLSPLKAMTQLENLCLQGEVDADLSVLASLPNLRKLGLPRATRATNQGSELEAKLPNGTVLLWLWRHLIPDALSIRSPRSQAPAWERMSSKLCFGSSGADSAIRIPIPAVASEVPSARELAARDGARTRKGLERRGAVCEAKLRGGAFPSRSLGTRNNEESVGVWERGIREAMIGRSPDSWRNCAALRRPSSGGRRGDGSRASSCSSRIRVVRFL